MNMKKIVDSMIMNTPHSNDNGCSSEKYGIQIDFLPSK